MPRRGVRGGRAAPRAAVERPIPDGITLAAFVAVIAVAAALRLFRLDHGLPELVHADAFKFVDEAARMISAGSLEPSSYQYPGLFTTLLAAAYHLAGAGTETLRHWVASLVSAAAGIGVVLVVYVFARGLCDRTGALIAAALSATCVASVTSSRIPAPDMLLVLFTTSSLHLLLRRGATAGGLAAAGALAGLAIGSKWTGLLLLPVIPVATWLLREGEPPARTARKTAAALAAAAAAFLATTPWFLVRTGSYLAAVGVETRVQRFGQIGRVQGGWFDYVLSGTITWEQPWLSTSLLGNLGLPLLIAAAAAVGLALAGWGERRAAILAGVTVGYLVIVSAPGRLKAFRFLLPVLPLVYILTGWLAARIAASLPPRRRGMVALLLAAGLVAWPVVKSVRYVAATLEPTTNELARDWMTANVPPGSRVFMGPFFTRNLRRLPVKVVSLRDPGRRQYGLPENLGPSPERDLLYHPGLVDGLVEEGVGYAILNSWFDGALSPVPENLGYFPRSVAGYEAFRERLEERAVRVHEIRGWSAGRLGPDIEFYRMDGEGARAP